MKGLLVVNGFLKKEKFEEIYQWLLEAGRKKGIELSFVDNTELLWLEDTWLDNHCKNMDLNFDFILFWDKDIRLAKHLEELGYFVLNSADSIAACDDKAETYVRLKKAKVPMPKTIVGPFTYENIGYESGAYLDLVGQCFGYPYVIKECFGSFGWQVYLVDSREAAEDCLKKVAGKPVIFQEYIKESCGRDVRIQVVGDKVIASMYRYSDTDFRANITNGGKMKPYEPSKEEQDLAVMVTKELGLSFAGVDLLFGVKGPLVCEVNSNAHFKNIYDCTGVNTAEHIMEYIIEQVEKRHEQ